MKEFLVFLNELIHIKSPTIMTIKLQICYLSLLLLLINCKDKDTSPAVYTIKQPTTPFDKGDRILGITPTESVKGFEESFKEAQKAGIQMVELNLDWNYFETTKENYKDSLGLLQAIAFYGAAYVKVGLSIASINTIKRTEPTYLKSKNFDDPEYISAFNKLIDWIIATKASNVELAYISVGNEVDNYLTGSGWSAYQEFTTQTIAHIHSNYPGIKAGVKVTVIKGLFGADKEHVKEIISLSDVALLNYYPQNENAQVLIPSITETHIKQILENVNKEIYFTEVGYQSGSKYCNSSEAKQAEFYHTLFEVWDKYKGKIKLININWLHDSSTEKVKELEAYYNYSDPAFLEFLSTLGLRNYDHTDKMAWKQILLDANARNWK